jgi:hypothetical protein
MLENNMKSKAEPIITDEKCQYGCNQVAIYKFANNKLCCSPSYNSCPGKKKQFSENKDHANDARKSPDTRTRLGITKTSQMKVGETCRLKDSGTIIRNERY